MVIYETHIIFISSNGSWGRAPYICGSGSMAKPVMPQGRGGFEDSKHLFI